jgi:hypothetical protein
MVALSDEFLRRIIGVVQRPFHEALGLRFVQDVAFIGNTGGTYPWEPTLFVDVDICVFVEDLGESVGKWLVQIGTTVARDIEPLGVDFELRVVRGPYKPALARPIRPVVLAHIALFTEHSYRERGALLRWGWRKYKCIREPERLRRLAPSRPTATELLFGPGGVEARLTCVRSGRVEMTEYLLPGFSPRLLSFGRRDPIFSEYCLSACATMARSHARVLGHPEADHLANSEFFPWYRRNLLSSSELSQAMSLKQRVRAEGYWMAIGSAPALAARFLAELASEVRANSGVRNGWQGPG